MQKYTWFFTLKEALSPAEAEQLNADFLTFLNQWKSHGTPVDGLITLKYNQFVIIQADPAQPRPSGCSIDSLRRSVEQILVHRQRQWVEPAYVAFKDAEGKVQLTHFQKIPELIAQGTLSAETTILDNTLSQSDDLSRWEVQLADSWLKRYLPEVKA